MNSGGHRGFTVVTIIVLIFAPFFTHHEWVYKLVGQRTETRIEQCVPKQPCPAKKVIVTIERQPIPPGGGDQGGHGDQGGNDHGGNGNGNDKGGDDHGGGKVKH